VRPVTSRRYAIYKYLWSHGRTWLYGQVGNTATSQLRSPSNIPQLFV